jgi:hypothetical protein
MAHASDVECQELALQPRIGPQLGKKGVERRVLQLAVRQRVLERQRQLGDALLALRVRQQRAVAGEQQRVHVGQLARAQQPRQLVDVEVDGQYRVQLSLAAARLLKPGVKIEVIESSR